VDEARAVLARLERIEALERGGADAGAVLSELRVLVEEAQAWARRERDPGADHAVARLRDSLTDSLKGGCSERARLAYWGITAVEQDPAGAPLG
jgi:hypothetical protein